MANKVTADPTACTNDNEWDPVPWFVLRLPDKRPGGVTHGICGQDYSVDCDVLRVTGC